jgi:hypothetical protein
MDKLGGIMIMLSILAAELAWYNSREGDKSKVKVLKIFSIIGGLIGIAILVIFALCYHYDMNAAIAWMDTY